MNSSRSPYGLLLASLAAAFLLLGWASRFAPLVQTSFGIVVVPAGANAVVEQIRPHSDAANAGVRRGDIILLQQLTLSDRYRLVTHFSPAGTPLTLHLVRGGAVRTVTVRAQTIAIPAAAIVSANWTYLYGITLTLLIVGLIALRRPSLATAALVLYGTGSISSFSAVGVFSWIPDPLYGVIAVALVVAISTLPILALLPFIARFPSAPSTRAARIRMHACDAVFLAAAAVFLFQAIYEPIPLLTWTALEDFSNYGLSIIILLFVAFAYAGETGEERRKVGWVIAGLVVTTVAYTVDDIASIAAITAPGPTQAIILDVATFLQPALAVALGYAVLRHRVMDIGFVLNRTVVYAVMTTLVVGAVGLVDWLSARFLSEQRLALAVEAIVTIGFGFALNWMHARTERLIDRLVFRQRHLAEKRIEYRIGALGFASSPAAIDDALALDAPDILNLASGAVFGRLSADAPFQCTASTGWEETPKRNVQADSLLVRSLRSLERPFFLDEVAIQDGDFPKAARQPVLAIPIVAQHDLIGFVLYGNHTDGGSPDPEEIALLARLAAAAGNAYGAVEARQWRQRAAALEASLKELNAAPVLP